MMSRFQLSPEPLSPELLKATLAARDCGACVTFEGWVRDHNVGRSVSALEYESYPEVALAEGNRILADACEKFGVANALCVHRVGALEVGDLAVWVGVSAGHRGEAFSACRFIIDEIKLRVPIWKKEHYKEGDTGWVNADPTAL